MKNYIILVETALLLYLIGWLDTLLIVGGIGFFLLVALIVVADGLSKERKHNDKL